MNDGGLNDQVQHQAYQVGFHHSTCGIARQLGRAPSTISRELTRQTVRPDIAYDARLAGHRARRARCRPRRYPKLSLYGELFELLVFLSSTSEIF